MSRISIDVTPEQHQRLKALAALQGKSIKEFVLASTLGAQNGGAMDQDLAELEAILRERLRSAEAGAISTRSVREVFQKAHRDEADRDLDA